MKAIHKELKSVFEIIAVYDPFFIGKCLVSGTTAWKKNEVCHKLDKNQFYVIMDWDDMDCISAVIDVLKTVIKK